MEKETARMIGKILDHPEIVNLLHLRKNEYGDRYLADLRKKMAYGKEIAESFGFEDWLVVAVLAVMELAIPNFQTIGDEFLLEVDPQYTRALYGRRLAEKLFHRLEPGEIQLICDGVAHGIEKTHSTPEEKIVQMIDTGFAFVVTLESRTLASLFFARYKDVIIEKTAKNGVLTDQIIPSTTWPRRAPVVITEEERQRRKDLLFSKFNYYLDHPDEIPQSFTEGWSDLDERVLVSYFVAGSREVLEENQE